MNCIVIRPMYDAWTSFAQSCGDEIVEALAEREVPHEDFIQNRANKDEIDTVLKHPSDYVVMGFGHGSEDSFFGQDSCVLFCVDEGHLFENNFFYLFSCLNGRLLGENIVNLGGKGFLGYKDEVKYHTENITAFRRAANKGILKMITDKCSLKEAYDVTIAAYDEEIEGTRRRNKFFANFALKENKAALVFWGDPDFKISNIINFPDISSN